MISEKESKLLWKIEKCSILQESAMSRMCLMLPSPAPLPSHAWSAPPPPGRFPDFRS